MNIKNLFPVFKAVEVNLSTGLRIGHMLAQHKYSYAKAGAKAYVENGVFFRMSKANPDAVVLADDSNAVGPYFIHYTEELFTNGIVDGLKYFALEALEEGTNYVCYPRLIALYSGDTFTTDNFTGELSTAKFAKVGAKGVLELVTTMPTGEGPVFQDVKSTMPDGTPAVQVTVIDPMQKAAAGVGA